MKSRLPLAATLLILSGLHVGLSPPVSADDDDREFLLLAQPLLERYCLDCHGADPNDIRGDLNLRELISAEDLDADFDSWESVYDVLRQDMMPPAEEKQPTSRAKQRFAQSFRAKFLDNANAQPGPFRPRRLSAHEYRNTLRSIFGFELEQSIIEAEQTVVEKSLVMKLLPTDPPGASGFTNDTSTNPLTSIIWDQYSYLVDFGLEQLFSPRRRDNLATLTGGPVEGRYVSTEQANQLLRVIARKAYRRPLTKDQLYGPLAALESLRGEELERALRRELKTLLMSPAFIYRGLLMPVTPGQPQEVDQFELAERLSYFLWADMPDDKLMELAAAGQLAEAKQLRAQVNRMLASPKARNMATDFGSQWFSLSEIRQVSNNPPVADALHAQPIDFLHYLFTEDRPILELIDSNITFANLHTAKFYPNDRNRLSAHTKQRGIEIEAVPNQRLALTNTPERGGLLTMPGILAMNRGPILRGTWILERILGEHLPDPPANVGQVEPNRTGEQLSFRQRFQRHRENAACAVCHDKIDPLGFALQEFDPSGAYVKAANYAKSARKRKRSSDPEIAPDSIDSSGILPSGESFDNFAQLKQLLVTTQRSRIVRTVVERMLAFALCRKLELHDRPTVQQLADRLEDDGTFGELILGIVESIPFQQTLVE